VAKLDDVSQGYVDAWNEFVDGKDPKDYLTDKITGTAADTHAKQMGRRNAARDYILLKTS
jgi:hypothetical protein